MSKKFSRIRRGMRFRYNARRLSARRLVVHRTLKHIYAQIISSDNSEVLVSASTVEKAIKKELKVTGNKDAAAVVGRIIAERSLKIGSYDVSFDRSGFKYHGRVRALAEASREYSLKI